MDRDHIGVERTQKLQWFWDRGHRAGGGKNKCTKRLERWVVKLGVGFLHVGIKNEKQNNASERVDIQAVVETRSSERIQ